MRHIDRGDVLLIVKATVATVIAWLAADRVMGSPTPYYAPLAALLVVDRTVVRSLTATARRVVAVGLGMALAWLVGTVAGLHWWSMGVVILGALVLGRWSRLGDQGVQVPTMALLSLLTAGGTSEDFTAMTMLETLVGGAIGVAVNLVILPPLHVDEPRAKVLEHRRRVRELLDETAGHLRDGQWDEEAVAAWSARADALREEEPGILDLIELGRESERLNPRDDHRGDRPAWDGYRETVEGLRRVTWHLAGIVRSLRDALGDTGREQPGSDFLARVADVLADVSWRCATAAIPRRVPSTPSARGSMPRAARSTSSPRSCTRRPSRTRAPGRCTAPCWRTAGASSPTSGAAPARAVLPSTSD